MGAWRLFSKKFLHSRGYISYKIRSRFYSKRNLVYLISFRKLNGRKDNLVYKVFLDSRYLQREARLLLILNKYAINVPLLYHLEKKGILMEYIDGQTLLEFYECKERGINDDLYKPQISMVVVLYRLALWLRDFYDVTERYFGRSIIMGDINFRNFLIRKSIYAIDFENCRKGEKEEDVGRMCAFMLTYNPRFTPWKKSVVKLMLILMKKHIPLNSQLIKDYYFQELEAMKLRRP